MKKQISIPLAVLAAAGVLLSATAAFAQDVPSIPAMPAVPADVANGANPAVGNMAVPVVMPRAAREAAGSAVRGSASGSYSYRFSTTTEEGKSVHINGITVGAKGVRVGDIRVENATEGGAPTISAPGVRVDERGVRAMGVYVPMGSTTLAMTYGTTSDLSALKNINALFAQAGVRGKGIIGQVQNKADEAISNRVEALNALKERIGQMQQLSADAKSALQQQVVDQISALIQLKGQITSATSTTELKDQVKSITDSFRTYVLTIPKTAILAAVDRMATLTGDMDTVAAKLQTIIDTASSAGKDVTAAQAALADYKAKIAEARSLVATAQNEVSSLQPDNGVQSVLTANNATLQDAMAKVKQAQAALVSARNDIGTIRQLNTQ